MESFSPHNQLQKHTEKMCQKPSNTHCKHFSLWTIQTAVKDKRNWNFQQMLVFKNKSGVLRIYLQPMLSSESLKTIECTTQKMNLNKHFEFSLTIMYHSFINCNVKHTNAGW